MSVFGDPGWLGPLEVVPKPVALATEGSFEADLGGAFVGFSAVFFTDFSFGFLQKVPQRRTQFHPAETPTVLRSADPAPSAAEARRN
jgi:hypothetical protein